MSGHKLASILLLFVFSVMGNFYVSNYVLRSVIGNWSILCNVAIGIAVGLALAEMTKD